MLRAFTLSVTYSENRILAVMPSVVVPNVIMLSVVVVSVVAPVKYLLDFHTLHTDQISRGVHYKI